MITPITRKELYLAKIIGEDVDIPETAKTREELFFLKILDNSSKIPEPITREELFLAKISGQDVELPEPKTRLELFLAKAAGVEIETPTPITREEIFWSNYSAIVDFEVEGVPPLTYKAIEGTLENYRIYGDTVDGESVGDRTGNLFDKSGSQYGSNLHWSPTYSLVYSDTYYGSPIMDVTGLNTITRSYTGTGANYFLTSDLSQFVNVSNGGTVDAGATVNVPDGYTKYVFNIPNTIRPDSIMVNSGSTALPYEPYGYKVAVTVSNGTDTLTTPIYLPEQIRKIGDEAEYIDYSEQKQHRVRKNLLPNTATSQTINGVTFTVNSDGSITCNGTATANTTFTINIGEIPNGIYIVSGCPNNGAYNTYRIDIRTSGNTPLSYNSEFVVDTGNGHLFNSTDAHSAIIRIENGYTCNNLTFCPMIRKADIEDDTYEPYITNTDIDITLPTLPTLTGTNVLSVGTAVQPSKVYVKYKGERQ